MGDVIHDVNKVFKDHQTVYGYTHFNTRQARIMQAKFDAQIIELQRSLPESEFIEETNDLKNAKKEASINTNDGSERRAKSISEEWEEDFIDEDAILADGRYNYNNKTFVNSQKNYVMVENHNVNKKNTHSNDIIPAVHPDATLANKIDNILTVPKANGLVFLFFLFFFFFDFFV